MMVKSTGMIVVFLLIVSAVYGQKQREVTAVLVDSADRLVSNASIRLLSETDTLSARSDEEGRFLLRGIKSPKFELSISHLGYTTKQVVVDVKANERYDLGKITLATRLVELDEISISAPDPVVFKGDTIEFATRHIQLEEGAFTEDLMGRLPGMQVDDAGRLTYMGKLVEKVRINGIDFFGGDVPLALKNLPAELINKVQLVDDYGEESRLTKVKSGQAAKVLNLVMDDDKNKGLFSSGRAGAGTERTYYVSGGGNYFNKKKQLGIAAGRNNVNTSPIQRIVSINSGDGSSGGITSSTGLGVDVSDAFGNWVDGAFGYQYTTTGNSLEGTTVSDQTYGEGRTMRGEVIHENRRDERIHEIGNGSQRSELTFRVNQGKTSIRIEPKYRYSESTSTTNLTDWQQLHENGHLALNQRNASVSTTANIKRSSSVNASMHAQLNEKGRNVMISGNYNGNTSREHEGRENRISFLTEQHIVERDSLQQQQIHKENQDENYFVKIQYGEPVFGKYQLNLGLSHQRNGQLDNRQVFDQAKGMAFVDSLSNGIDVTQRETIWSTTFQNVAGKAWHYQVGLNWVNLNQTGQFSAGAEHYQRSAAYIVPSMMLNYGNVTNRAILSYDWQVTQPGFSQLNPVANRSNPQITLLGNPALSASLMHRLQGQWYKTMDRGLGTLVINLMGSYTQDKITQKVDLIQEENGLIRQQYQYGNVSGDYHLLGSYQMTKSFSEMAIGKIRTLSLAGGSNVARERFFEEEAVRESMIIGANQNMDFRLMQGRWGFSVGVGYNFQHNSVGNTLGMQTLQTLSSTVGGKMPLWFNFNFSGNMSKMFNWGYTGPANANPTIISLSLQNHLYKKKLALALQVNDLLDQNVNVGRTVSRNGVSDYRSNALGRYIFLSCSWRFGRFGNSMVVRN